MSLDPTTSEFDPEAALKRPSDVILPNPDIRPLNNLAEYVSRTRGLGRSQRPRPSNLSQQGAQASTSGRGLSKADDRQAWLQSTLTDKPEEQEQKDVLNLMPKKTGPLAFLYKCVVNKTKIKVWTRNFNEVRGICTGYLVVFDKHWNLAMQDVDETYLRAVKRKSAPMGKESVIDSTSNQSQGTNTKWIQRHVNQLFIRGDNVVMISAVT